MQVSNGGKLLNNSRRKWPKRLFVGSAAAAGVAGGVAVMAEPGLGRGEHFSISENKLTTFIKGTGIGPIYKFEMEDDGHELPLDYDVAAMEQFFKNRPLEVLCRTGEILSEVLPYFTRAFIWEYLIRSVQYKSCQYPLQRIIFQEKDPGSRGFAAEVRGGVAGAVDQAGAQLH